MLHIYFISLSVALISDWLITDLGLPDQLYYRFKKSWILKPPFNCSLCLSFWAGWVVFLTLPITFESLLIPFISSALSTLINTYKSR